MWVALAFSVGVALLMALGVAILDCEVVRLARIVRQQRADLEVLRRRTLLHGDAPLHDVSRLSVYGPRDPEDAA
jgi:hypothetical protein